jgi:hypothetical protein
MGSMSAQAKEVPVGKPCAMGYKSWLRFIGMRQYAPAKLFGQGTLLTCAAIRHASEQSPPSRSHRTILERPYVEYHIDR